MSPSSRRMPVCAALMLAGVCTMPGLVGSAEGPLPPPGECPQPRFTQKAPAEFLALANPVADAPGTPAAGQRLYNGTSNSAPCTFCHGARGDGKGALARDHDPRPRNFQCKDTVNGIPDGQLFWIIRNGSPGTGMPASKDLSDQQIWQVVAYLRQLAKR